MTWSNIFSYWTMLGLAVQSSRWEQNMNAKLLQMALATEHAISLHAASVKNEEVAIENEEKSDADKLEAESLQEEAEALIEKSEMDNELAGTEQAEVDELEVDIAADEEQSAAHSAAVAIDETTFEAATSDGATDTTEAARLEFQAHSEEVVVGFCEFFPLLDIICDSIGVITSVGSEVGAAAGTMKASSDFAVATAAKADQESELALLAELQAKELEETEAASSLQAEEAELVELAEQEGLEGKEEGATAKEFFEKATLEHEAAVSKQAEAASEEAQAVGSSLEAINHGVLACWDAIMAGAVGFITFCYFVGRVVTSFLMPGAVRTIEESKGLLNQNGFSKSIGRDICYYFHHCAIFLFCMESLGSLVPATGKFGLRARGGFVLLFALLGAVTQIIMLHAIPSGLSSKREVSPCQLIPELLQRSVAFTLLFMVELLILWVNMGQVMFSPTEHVRKWLWWILFASILAVYLCFFKLLVPADDRLSSSTSSVSSNEEKHCEELHGVKDADDPRDPSESDSLLSIDLKKSYSPYSTKGSGPTQPQFSVKYEICRLQILFEMLVLSCMLALLKHCLPSVQRLWPVSKALLVQARPDWLLPVSLALGFLGFALLVWHRRSADSC
jgi:hypothetical protein